MRRRTFLAGSLGLFGTLPFAARAAAQSGKKLIVVIAEGGWDPTFVFDPKPNNPLVDGPYPDLTPLPTDIEEVVHYGDLTVNLNTGKRPAVTDFFDANAHRVAIVRGLWCGSVAHPVARRRIFAGSDDPSRPDLATIAGVGWSGPLGVIDLSGTSQFGEHSQISARTGVNRQLGSLLDPSARLPRPDGVARPGWQPSTEDNAAIEAWLADRAALDAQTHQARATFLAGRDEARGRALDLLAQGPEIAQHMPEGKGLISQVDFAVEMLKSGVTRAIVLDSDSPWDTHALHLSQHKFFNDLFKGLNELVRALDAADMFQDTVVAVLSEMGRTPKRNADDGTDHWPYTAALVFGGGITGGRVIGGTDDSYVGQNVDLQTGAVTASGDLLRFDSFGAGLIAHLEVDHEEWFPGVTPFRGFRV